MNFDLCTVLRCHEQPFIQYPLFLCRQHALMVSMNVTDVLYANALSGQATTGLDVERASVCLAPVWREPSHPPVVYFLVNGDRVKIGTSTNITARVSALSLRKNNAALLLQGGSDLENALHQHFDSDRIGMTEWFVLSPRIQDYITRRKQADAALRQPKVQEDATDQERSVKAVLPAPRERSSSANNKITETLGRFATSPESTYLHKDQIATLTGLEGSTLNNALSHLVKSGRIHRQTRGGRDVRGMYGLGAVPETGE